MAPRIDAITSSHDYVSLAPRPRSSEDNDDDLKERPPKSKKKKPWQRLGLTSFLILLLGSAALLAVLLILGLLWKSSIRAANGGLAETPWVSIFRANRATTLVTLCTALLRTVIALQSSLATGMLAGIILEIIGAPLLKAPFFSIIRAVSVAPSNLLSAVRSRPKDTLSFLVYTLVVLEVLLTMSSQFLSAILITDFAEGTFANMDNSTDICIFANVSEGNAKFWEFPPASSWTFAEASESFTKGATFDDTGHTYRAFLPFEDEAQRTRLRKFRGPAHVIDHRVVCVGPSLANLSFISEPPTPYWSLSGQVAIEIKSYPMLKGTKPQAYAEFSCALPTPERYTYHTEGESSLCHIASENWGISLDPLVIPTFERNMGPDDPRGKFGSPGAAYFPNATTFMILDIVSMESMSKDEKGDYKIVRNDGPWVMVADAEAVEAVRVTVCMTNLEPETFTVDIYSAWDSPEPKLFWDHQAQRYNTEAARHQLGALLMPETFKNRRILTLAPRSRWQDFSTQETGIRAEASYFADVITQTLRSRRTKNQILNSGVILSREPRFRLVDNNAYISHIHTFQDTLHDTKSPALALQAMLARITQMVYYEQLLRLNVKSAALASFSSTALIPMKWTGLIAATALIAIHLALLVIITALYLKSTTESVLGSSWQAISQVISDDTLPILEHADRMNDEDIRRWAKSQSLNPESRSVIRYRNTGRVCLGIQPKKT